MTQEEKQLLLKDLCTRLSYNVKVGVTYNKEHGSSNRLKLCSEGCLMLNINILNLYIEDEIYLKPYLRPMSSMTESEILELYKKFGFYYLFYPYDVTDEWRNFKEALKNNKLFLPYPIWGDDLEKGFNYFNSIYIDYRGLIEKGLALEAPERMYNIKN